MKRVIGIDPDSIGFECVEVSDNPGHRYFTNLQTDKFISWIKEVPDTLIAVEGKNGMSVHIEHALRKNKIIFYSFKPGDVDHFRKAILGINKNNLVDAEAAGRLALSLEPQNKLEQYRRVWFPDEVLVNLTRQLQLYTKQQTAIVNGLWKLIRAANPRLYTALNGKSTEYENKYSLLKNKSTLNLIINYDKIINSNDLRDSTILEYMGGRRDRGFQKRLNLFQDVLSKSNSIHPDYIFTIKMCAQQLLFIEECITALKKKIDQYSQHNVAVKILCKIKGVGITTAASAIAELIDIRRFESNNKLAAYAGLVQREHSTGDTKRFYSSSFCNKRLKNILMTMAKNIVLHDRRGGLGRYYASLQRRGFKKMEAYKRVARALVRVIFRDLYLFVVCSENKMGSMATVSKDHKNVLKRHKSNILPNHPKINILSQDKENVSKKEKSLVTS